MRRSADPPCQPLRSRRRWRRLRSRNRQAEGLLPMRKPLATRARSSVSKRRCRPCAPAARLERARCAAIRLPSYERVVDDPVSTRTPRAPSTSSRTRATRARSSGARRARRLAQPAANPADHARDGSVFAAPFQRRPHPRMATRRIPAFEMIRLVNIIAAVGGCTFCSITEREGASSEPLRKAPSSPRSKRSATRRLDSRNRLRPGGPSRQVLALVASADC